MKRILLTAYNHKFKLIFFLGSTYAAKKCYDLYIFIKPFLAIKNQLSAANTQSQAAEVEPATPSLRTLKALMTS